MGAVHIIVDLERTGHRLSVDADQLAVNHASTLTDGQRSAIRKHRERIVELVTDQQEMVERGWIRIQIPAPEVTSADLEVDLRHWPGVARIEEAVLERAGVARDEAMRQIRKQYERPEQEGDHARL